MDLPLLIGLPPLHGNLSKMSASKLKGAIGRQAQKKREHGDDYDAIEKTKAPAEQTIREHGYQYDDIAKYF